MYESTAALAAALTRDSNGDGVVDKFEFRKAVRLTGIVASDAACDRTFHDFDVDGSGTIGYDEYIRYTLRELLAKSFGRVMDLFKKWDSNGDGRIGRKELHRACAEMGFRAPEAELNLLFDEVDADGSGSVTYKELNAVLRQGASVKLAADLKPGAKGRAESWGARVPGSGARSKVSAARDTGVGVAAEFRVYDYKKPRPQQQQQHLVLEPGRVAAVRLFAQGDDAIGKGNFVKIKLAF